jgi:hypothetical protein
LEKDRELFNDGSDYRDSPIITCIQQIAEEARASKLSLDFQKKVSIQAKRVAEFLGCSEFQAILFSIIFNLNFRSVTDLSDIAQFVDTSIIQIVNYLKEVEILVQLKILRSNRGSDNRRRRRTSTTLNCIEYYVNKAVFQSVINNDQKYCPSKWKILSRPEIACHIKTIQDGN